jgi:hypothetical protein
MMRNIHFLNALLIVAAVIVFIAVSRVSVGAEATSQDGSSASVGVTTRTTAGDLNVDADARTEPNATREKPDQTPQTSLGRVRDTLQGEPTPRVDGASGDDARDNDAANAGAETDFKVLDRDNDGSVTSAEFSARVDVPDAKDTFDQYDTDKDGRLDSMEFQLFNESQNNIDAQGGMRAEN